MDKEQNDQARQLDEAIVVSISGPRGSGKTTAAILVAKLLAEFGPVDYVGRNDVNTREIRHAIESDDSPTLAIPVLFVISDPH